MKMAFSRWVDIVLLSLNVNSDNNARNNGRRFNLNGNNLPNNVAPMILVCTLGQW